MNVKYDEAIPSKSDLLALYDAVNWVAYTRNIDKLISGIRRSLRVVCAYDDDRLVGLARVIGDGETIVYLQDILVDPNYQGRGIGRELFTRAFAGFDVRQKVLITDDDPAQRDFYTAMGFKNTVDLDYPIRTYVQFS